MRLEKQWSYHYIIDEFLSKKIKIYLWNDLNINSDKLLLLVDKYLSFIWENKKFQDFADMLYNNNLLEKVLKINFRYYILTNCKSLWCTISNDLKKELSKTEKYFDETWIYDFVFNSNRIEWSKIPKEHFIDVWKNKSTSYKNKNEIKEIHNTIKAFKYLNEDFLFNERSIKRLYHILTKWILMPNSNPYPQGYKKVPIIVGNSTTVLLEKVPQSMKNLIDFYQKNKKNIFPIKLAFDFHFNFEKIHPFTDGNWRIWRMLMNKILQVNNYLPFIIYDENRKSYFNVFEKTESDRKKYYKFMMEQYYKTLKFK